MYDLRLLLALSSVIAMHAHTPTAESAVAKLAEGRILFLGDSITQAGGYVTFIEYSLDRAFPKESFDIFGLGLASETVSGLSESVHPFPRPCVHDRLWAALDMVKPKTVFACYGINDGIYHPLSEERFKAFKDGIHKLIAIDRAAGARTILITPPPFDPIAAGNSLRPATAPDFSYMNVYERYDDVVAEYGRWEMTLSAPDVQVIDVHTPLLTFVEANRKTDPKFTLSGDGVHINDLGHWIMAKAILTSLGLAPSTGNGFEGSRTDTAAQDLDAVTKDPVFKLVDKRRRLRSDNWLPYIGYVRDIAFKTFSVAKAEKEVRELQERIDQMRRRSKS
ncbi:MAG: SGNH/GDSL hydrolase family protein [Fimbriimonas sp.]|nr:SGNH/GDSL hydrolase family protein [Fimbriimonas sp.]